MMNLLALVVKLEVKFHPCTLYKLFFLQDQFCDLDDARIIVLFYFLYAWCFVSFICGISWYINWCLPGTPGCFFCREDVAFG